MMSIDRVNTKIYHDQNPGTSGLRKSVAVFQQPHYLANFIQAIFNSTGDFAGKLLILGGDGRAYTREAIQIILKMAAANKVGRVKLARSGLLSTPAASHLIRKYKAHAGIILSASHNPGGYDGDFGIKYNIANGGAAPELVTKSIFEHTKLLTHYQIMQSADIDIEQLGEVWLGDMCVEIIDGVQDYAALMESIFDFDQIRSAVANGFKMRFDAMHAVTGPYAEEIFVKRLGFGQETLLRAVPLPDFGGDSPDPTPQHAAQLYALMMQRHQKGDSALDVEPVLSLGAASDGDGDRNMILGPGQIVSPSDSLAIMAANATYLSAYKHGLRGVARSMPTSQAIDRVACKLGFPIYETPTGWKFFGNLLDAGLVDLCGEESFSQGGAHIREKDGIWAVLFWLNLLVVRNCSVEALLKEHWQTYGRTYYARYDYEDVPLDLATDLIEDLRAHLPKLAGTNVNGLEITQADDFVYTDPVNGYQTGNQGIRLFLGADARVICRLSGTGTKGATLRVYFEKFEPNADKQHQPPKDVLLPLINTAHKLLKITDYLPQKIPNIIV